MQSFNYAFINWSIALGLALQNSDSSVSVCRCESPLWVENATALFNMTSGQLKVTCIPGHRFYNGLISMTFTCYSDGSWMNIKPCNGIIVFMTAFVNWPLWLRRSLKICSYCMFFNHFKYSVWQYLCIHKHSVHGRQYWTKYLVKVE